MTEQSNTAAPWRSIYCGGEECKCGQPAAAKVEEVIFDDDPVRHRHPLTTYLCSDCFSLLMGRSGVALVEKFRRDVS